MHSSNPHDHYAQRTPPIGETTLNAADGDREHGSEGPLLNQVRRAGRDWLLNPYQELSRQTERPQKPS